MNKPVTIRSMFAGAVYPETPGDAIDYFSSAIKSAPDVRDVLVSDPPVLIVPHIDLRVNMSCYAAAYKRLGNRVPFADTFVILGVGHKCPHAFSSIPIHYETILGKVETNMEAWNHFAKSSSVKLERAPASFKGEHSIEFVVIWLQALRKMLGIQKEFRIIPILLGGLFQEIAEGVPPSDDSEFGQFRVAFKALVDELSSENTAIIASIDGCHVGPRFDHPFNGDEKAQKVVTAWETELWNLCGSDTFSEYFQWLHRVGNQFYFDGVGVLTLLLQSYRMRAHIDSYSLWYEKDDQSFVTFSGGCMVPVSRK